MLLPPVFSLLDTCVSSYTEQDATPAFVHARVGLRPYRPNTFPPTRQLSHSAFLLLKCHLSVYGAELPTLVHIVAVMRRCPPFCLLGIRLCPGCPVISTPRDSKAGGVLTNQHQQAWPDSQSRLITTYPTASSRDAVTGLSYPAIFPACAQKYQRLQISPQRPDTSRCPQQPTCGAWVIQSPASPKVDL